MKKDNDNVINLIRMKLRVLAPNSRAFLFGSRARGNATSESDWDILILLDKNKIENMDYDNIAYPLFEMGWEFDQHFSIKLYTLEDWRKRSFTPFYKNVEQEGIVL